MQVIHTTSALLLTLCVAACADPLEASDDVAMGPVGEIGGPNVVNDDQGDGSTLSVIDASDSEAWILFDLETGTQIDDPSDETWDLGFQRFHIKLNGGASGDGMAAGQVLADTPFAELTQALADGYVQDEPDGDDDNDYPDYVLSDWYDYNVMTHVLTANQTLYLVESTEGAYFKLVVEGYYDDAGTPAHVQFRWAHVPL